MHCTSSCLGSLSFWRRRELRIQRFVNYLKWNVIVNLQRKQCKKLRSLLDMRTLLRVVCLNFPQGMWWIEYLDVRISYLNVACIYHLIFCCFWHYIMLHVRLYIRTYLSKEELSQVIASWYCHKLNYFYLKKKRELSRVVHLFFQV